MGKNRGFSNIQSFEELETSLQMVQYQLRTSKVTQQMHTLTQQVQSLKAGNIPSINWNKVAIFFLDLIKQRLSD
ncbi:MAG: hypothetical protein J5478_04770 [Bacteroidales bacterium]|nr:hypothetical protein [Bacteroidales bacterium]MBR6423396.1 hypothetical protein [Bacteroidales bacterium]